MELKRNNIFFVKQILICYIFIFLGILIGSIFIWANFIYDFVLAFIIYLPFPFILVLISKKNIDAIMYCSRKKISKGGVITIASFLYLAKYLIVIIPIVIYSIISIFYPQNMFNLFSIIIATMIYPISSFLAVILNKK